MELIVNGTHYELDEEEEADFRERLDDQYGVRRRYEQPDLSDSALERVVRNVLEDHRPGFNS